MQTIRFDVNRASTNEVAQHLHACDPYFVSPLSLRVDIQSYAKKIVEKATRFEAWSGMTLVGLVAMYASGIVEGKAFITNVSVMRDWSGQGVARALMTQCVAHARCLRLQRIELEVEAANLVALRLYAKNGFTPVNTSHQAVKMALDLHSEENNG